MFECQTGPKCGKNGRFPRLESNETRFLNRADPSLAMIPVPQTIRETLGDKAGSPDQATVAANAKCFPLPMTAFERYAMADDRDECPMTSWIELVFDAPLRSNFHAKAIRWATHKHPLLASVAGHVDGELVWDYDPNYDPPVHRDESLRRLVRAYGASPRPIDLSLEPGCRHWVDPVENADGSRGCKWTIQLHHAVCDGVGLRRFLIDVLDHYAALVREHDKDDESGAPASGPADAPEVSESKKPARRRPRAGHHLQPGLLKQRDDYTELNAKPIAEPLTFWQKITGAYYFHCQTPRALGRPDFSIDDITSAQRDDQVAVGEPLVHRELTVDQTSTLTDRVKTEQAGLNEIALTALMHACAERIDQLGGNARSRIRLLMPIDLRGRAELSMPAANRLSFSFLGRTIAQCADHQRLLDSVVKETQWIKQSRVYMDFLNSLSAIVDRPKWLRFFTRRRASMSTSVLTFAGDIARGLKHYFPEVDGRRQIGDVGLTHLHLAPPARPGTSITLGLCITNGRLSVSANWDRGQIERSEVERFMDRFVAHLHADPVPAESRDAHGDR